MEVQPDPSLRHIWWKVNLGINCGVLSGFCWERGGGRGGKGRRKSGREREREREREGGRC